MKMRAGTILTAAITLLLLAPATAVAQAAPAGTPLANATALQSGDIVKVRIWNEPELSGDYTVDEHGMLVLPKIGRINATGEPANVLADRISRGFQRFLTHSSIQVVPMRRIRILGAVRNPGLYPVEPTMTIGDALALAGGATAAGHLKKIELLRGSERVVVQLSTAARLDDTPLRSGDQLYVPERSWISRNPGILAAGVSAALTVLITGLIR